MITEFFMWEVVQKKWKLINTDPHDFVITHVNIASAMAYLTNEKILLKAFADVAYSEPIYLKGFYEE